MLRGSSSGFNVLTFGIEGERAALEGGLAKLRAMRAAALEYVLVL